MKLKGIDETPNSWRVRQLEPNFDKYATKEIGGGVSLVLGIKSGKTQTQSIIFKKDKFPTADSVKAWIEKHSQYKMAEIEDVDAGKDKAAFTEDDALFAVKLSDAGEFSFNEILREGTFTNSTNGKTVEVSEETIDNIIKHFYANVRGVNYDGSNKPAVPWDYAHKSDGEAPGWIGELEKRNHVLPDGKTVKSLWAKNLCWSAEAQEAIKNGVWKYASVDYHDYFDKETGKTYKDVLHGCALTNRPAVHWLAPVRLAEATKISLSASQQEQSKHSGTAAQFTKGDKKMIEKLKNFLGAHGVQLSESVSDEYVVDKAIEKMTYLSEINADATKQLSEIKASSEAISKKLSEAETELKAVKLKEFEATKAEVMEGVKKAFTPAQLKDEKHFINVLLSEGKFDVVKGIVADKGVAFKESKKTDEAEKEDDEDEMDVTQEWDGLASNVKHAAISKYMEAAGKDLNDGAEYAKADKALAKKHNEMFAAKKAAAKKGR